MKNTIWEFYLDKKNEHRWRASDRNGNVLFISAEGYKNKEDAEQCAKRAGWGKRKDADNTTFSSVELSVKNNNKSAVEAIKNWFKTMIEVFKSWFGGQEKPKSKSPQHGNKDGFQ